MGIPLLDAKAGLRRTAQAIGAQLGDAHAGEARSRVRACATAAATQARRAGGRTEALARRGLAGAVKSARSAVGSVRHEAGGHGTTLVVATRPGAERGLRVGAGVAVVALAGGTLATVLWRRRRS
ncbi:hypothetical protein [Streptomyces sp. NRRL S-350]|uniref:hypothetical protein n=1 Tax=Streptomyces sp. NRRL S-350 TaxID=1463902 RepID=UPI00131ACCBC|nr:hypothetical protein [Streptomyces sp. NRRL S-350]